MRVFFQGRGVFEAHPLSIMSASRGTTCLSPVDLTRYFGAGDINPVTPESSNEKLDAVQLQREGAGILLGVRVMGDWTRALNEYARVEGERLALPPPLPITASSSSSNPQASQVETQMPMGLQPIPVQVMFDGPYGGCELDLSTYERVLLVAGGSGATFALGVLDELIARSCLSGEGVTRRVEFVWCIRSFGSIKWFAPLLRAIALAAAEGRGLELRISIYVTCLCAREEVPEIPGMEVRVGGRPDMRGLVAGMIGKGGAGEKGKESVDMEMCGCGCAIPEKEGSVSEEGEGEGSVEQEKREKGSCCSEEQFEGRLAVCASGPGSLTREAANAVARWAGVGRGVGLHTEVFAI
jgi:ferric-chelate reductase